MSETTCECGCGEVIERRPHHSRTGTPRFKLGHHSRTEEYKSKARARHAETLAGLGSPNSSGLCLCGCGEKTNPAAYSCAKRGMVKGEPLRYLRAHHLRGRMGTDANGWKGGMVTSYGYVLRLARDHPRANGKGYVFEHRMVMEEHLGRLLDRTETVHHKNGVKDDNRIENLELRSGNHGRGATVEDRVADALDVLRRYAPERLAA